MNQFSRIVILISGNGSNLQAIINAIANHKLHAHISAVISDNAEAYGLVRAQNAKIPTHIITKNTYPEKIDFENALIETISQYQPQFIVLAGFMRILTNYFVKTFYGKIINIHPSLLPKYPGLNTHERVLLDEEKQHGVTIHLVTATVDAGPILAQASINILPDDTKESLKQKVQCLEHQLYPETLQKMLLGEINHFK